MTKADLVTIALTEGPGAARICRRCKYHEFDSNDNDLCMKHVKTETDVIKGGIKVLGGRASCIEERASAGPDHCGKDGKFWEKASRWKRTTPMSDVKIAAIVIPVIGLALLGAVTAFIRIVQWRF